jgi:toxin ParE1/3/4
MQPKVKKQILMSAHKYQLILTSLARKDFRDLISYTLQTWGKEQSYEYSRKIDTALNAICENPEIGRKKHGRMMYGAGRHHMYYIVKQHEIWVIRILHERMDAIRYLV